MGSVYERAGSTEVTSNLNTETDGCVCLPWSFARQWNEAHAQC